LKRNNLKRLSISQRNITTFDEKVMIAVDNGCINCHIYSMQDPDLSFFHLRHKEGGTIIQQHHPRPDPQEVQNPES